MEDLEFKSAKANLPAKFNGKEYSDLISARVISLVNGSVPEATHRMWCLYAGIRGAANLGLTVSTHRIKGRHETLRSILVPSELAHKASHWTLVSSLYRRYVRAETKQLSSCPRTVR